MFGFWCLDASNREDKRMPLNGGAVKELAAVHYGNVIYPEIMVDIILSWMVYLKQHDRQWSECWLFKEDIKSCFPLLNMDPTAALHLAMRVAVDIIDPHQFCWYVWLYWPSRSVVGSRSRSFMESSSVRSVCVESLGR